MSASRDSARAASEGKKEAEKSRHKNFFSAYSGALVKVPDIRQAYPDAMDSIKAVRSGLPGSSLKDLAETLQIPMSDLYSVLHVNSRSAQRMMKNESLDIDTSDRLMRLFKVFTRSVDVFGDRDKANRWLKTPNYSLGDLTPLSLLDTTDGVELVLNSLVKIEYGVFG